MLGATPTVGVTNHALGMGISTNVNVDKLTLLWRYPTEVMHSILAKAREVIQNGGGLGYRIPANPAGAQARLLLMLLDEDAQPIGDFADVRFYLALSAKGTPHSYVRVEWNPAKAGSLATAFLLDDLKAFLPDSDLMANAYVTRIDLAVDVPGIRCAQLAAQRTSNHKKAEIYVNAKGEVNSIRLGARGSSPTVGTFLRVYDKPLPDFANQMGVRAEIEVSRPGYLAGVHQIENPFSKFRLYQFPPDVSDGVFGCFISTIREKGPKRALAMLSSDKGLALEFQAVLDQCAAPWWEPATLWARAKHCTADVFVDYHPGAAHALLGQAA